MTSRLKLVVILLASLLSLLSVLHVNNALDIAQITSGDTAAAPVIEVNIEDTCNSVMDMTMTLDVTRDGAFLDVKSSLVDLATPCNTAPFALIATSNLHLRLADGRIVERSFSLKTGPTIAKIGTLERKAGSSSTFAVRLKGDTDGQYRFASNALSAGFGESALQVLIVARNLTCPEPDTMIQSGPAFTASGRCAIPLRAIVQYANTAFDVAAAIPPNYYLVPGPRVPDTKSSEGYSTTRLLWAERATTPSSVIKGTLTGFEIHLVDRHNVALKQFITVAGSAVFGTLVSMLLTFRASHALRQPPEAMAFEALPPPAQPSSLRMTSPENPQSKHESTQGSAADALGTTLGPSTPWIALGIPLLLVAIAVAARFISKSGRSGTQ